MSGYGLCCHCKRHGAEAFKEVLDSSEMPKIVVIGPQTAKACEKAGLTVTAVAKKADSEGISQAILQNIQDIMQADNDGTQIEKPM